MSVKDFIVVKCERSDISDFVERYHYSGNINGCISNYCFALYRGDEMIGAAFFGKMAMAGQWKRFSDNANDVTELRRLVCIDDTPKNTESYFIGKMLKWLKKNTKIKKVVSYSDLEYNHVGTIYAASNFKKIDVRKGAKVIMWNGKRYHDKTIRTKYRGELKPYAKRLKEALETGEAFYKDTKGKVTWVYEIKRPLNQQTEVNLFGF